MAKLSQLLTLECMLEAYDSLNVHDALVIDCHRQCIEGVVDGINQQLSRLLNSKVHLSFRNVLVANFDTMKNPAHWLKCKLFSDLPKEDSKVLMDKIELMVYQMKSLMLKMFDVNAEYVELFFKKLKNCRKQKYITDYELWKADKPQLTMDLLTEYQAEITADMLQSGILKYDRIPTGEEMEHIDRDKLAKKLKKTRTLSEEFYVECAKLRRYSYWDDEMFKINHHMLCKHLFSIFGKLTSHQHILLFEYDIQMKQIHEDMMKLLEEQQNLSTKAVLMSPEAMIYWKRLMVLGLVDENCQLMPKTSRKQAMYIVEPFAAKLGLKNLWKPFEEFWGLNNLAQEKWKFQQTGILPPIHQDIDNVFKD